MKTSAAGAWVVVAGLAGLALVATWRRVATAEHHPLDAPALDDRGRYAGSDSCRSCHPAAYTTWHESFHRTMTQRAGPESIRAPFDGKSLDAAGRYRVERDGDVFYVRGPGPERRRVVLVTGSHHMQVYWPEPDKGGRLEAFAFAYLIPEQRWVPNEATLLRPPAPTSAARGENPPVTYTWNRVCIKCHAVAGVPGYSAEADVAATRVVELGIACEACHGPAQDHVDHNRNPARRYAAHLGDAPESTMMNPGAVAPDTASQACGQCHSITVFHDDDGWVEAGHGAAPPDGIDVWGTLVQHPLTATNDLADSLLDDDPDFFANRFWSDGMVRVSGREYNGLVESPCRADVSFSCLSCHSMHTGGAAWADDQLVDGDLCTGCHAGEDHSNHPVGSAGRECMNCHMPHTTYGLLKAIRSHTIDSPNVDATLVTGRPNACNLCHLDKSLQWTADQLERLYGIETTGDIPREAAGPRWLLAGDAGQRALTAWHLSWAPAIEASGDGWQAPLLTELLDDPYGAVRIIAERSLAKFTEPPDREAPARPEVLLHAGGRPDRNAVAALQAERNDRPVALAE